MRVLVCIPCLLTGGTEIQTLSLTEALVAAGHSVDVACYFEYSPLMVENYERAGARVHLLSADGTRPQGTRRRAAMLWRGLRRAVREVQPDAAHVQYMAPGAIPILILRLLGVKKIIATVHTAADIYSPRGLQLVQALSRRLLRAFQCITLAAEQSFFPGEEARLYSPGMAARHGSHFTIYNNIPSYIELRKEGRVHSDTLTVGVVSRLEEIKGMDLVVPAMTRVFAEADRTSAECRLLVVGDGSLRGLMERQAEEAGIISRVSFAGRRAQNELQGYYDEIDVLLMPSRSEGFGLTAAEGMARGCVPVVAATGGLPEVVRDGQDGLLHEPGSAESLADRVLVLVNDRALLRRLSEGARRRAADFAPEAYRRRIAALYDEI